ncbi:sulfotransferase domain-containing protein [Salinibacter ruber]|uniref:sulfotransferase domain-containing protein n=2 Tax=Salinibacter ruber TaxID=146919 RepID=UPI00207356EB|nr:sulfotransferase domain-containing protein [Salinibacter ruber]
MGSSGRWWRCRVCNKLGVKMKRHIKNYIKTKSSLNYNYWRSIYHEYILKSNYKYIRKKTGHLRVLPNFMIVGTQKGGTTYLYKRLVQHPKVLSAEKKEIHYFDDYYNKSTNWYRSHFPTKMQMKINNQYITGEATPYYLYDKLSPKRIASIVPNVKIIILLRNPVKRAISHYWYEKKSLKNEHLPLMEALKKEEERLARGRKKKEFENRYKSFEYKHFSYKHRGLYQEQIKRYKKYFSSSQLMFIKSERMFSDNNYIQKIFGFLDLPRTYTSKKVVYKNSNNYPNVKKAERYLKSYFQDKNTELKKIVGFDW